MIFYFFLLCALGSFITGIVFFILSDNAKKQKNREEQNSLMINGVISIVISIVIIFIMIVSYHLKLSKVLSN